VGRKGQWEQPCSLGLQFLSITTSKASQDSQQGSPHATTPFASIIKLLSAQLGAPAPCYPKTVRVYPSQPHVGLNTPHRPHSPSPARWGNNTGRVIHSGKGESGCGKGARRGSLRGGEQEPVAFISRNLGQDSEGAGGAGVGQLFVSHHLIQGCTE